MVIPKTTVQNDQPLIKDQPKPLIREDKPKPVKKKWISKNFFK